MLFSILEVYVLLKETVRMLKWSPPTPFEKLDAVVKRLISVDERDIQNFNETLKDNGCASHSSAVVQSSLVADYSEVALSPQSPASPKCLMSIKRN